MGKRHVVRLTDDRRAELEGRFAQSLTLRQRNRVQILLRSDGGETDAGIADGLGITPPRWPTSASGSRPRDWGRH